MDYCLHQNKRVLLVLLPLVLQGEWILSGRDVCNGSKQLCLHMYAVKCVNVGSSKDPFLTQVSDFAVLFGNVLDAEVDFHFHLHLRYSNIRILASDVNHIFYL